MQTNLKPLLQVVRDATGLFDAELSQVTGIPVSSVHAIRVGRMRENLTEAQREALVSLMHRQIEMSQDALAEIEMRA